MASPSGINFKFWSVKWRNKKELFVYTNIVSSDTCANVFSLHVLSIILIFIQKLLPSFDLNFAASIPIYVFHRSYFVDN